MTKVLLTGSNGFVGSHVVEHLLKNTDWQIIGLDKLSYASNGFDRIKDIKNADLSRFSLFSADLNMPVQEGVAKEIGEIDYILHLAAESHVDNSISNPVPFVMNNVASTLNLLEYAKKLPNLKKFVYFSTDEVYGTAPEGKEYSEGEAHKSGNPYSASKSAAEQICRAYQNTYKVPVIITNTMNIIGERQHFEKFLPKIIRACMTGEELQIHANPECTKAGVRKYLHARNVAAALLFILENENTFVNQHDAAAGVYNIIGEAEFDNEKFAQIVGESVKKRFPTVDLKYKLVNFHSSRPGHDLRYALNGDKLKSLGYEHPKTILESLDKTVGWYLNPDNNRWLGLEFPV
jgi:dTDP-glucose 4,6-dehydratase